MRNLLIGLAVGLTVCGSWPLLLFGAEPPTSASVSPTVNPSVRTPTNATSANAPTAVSAPVLVNSSTTSESAPLSLLDERLRGGWYAEVDYLLWRVRRGDLDLAVVKPNGLFAPQGSIASVDLDTRSGYRVGAGYRIPESDWQLGARFTDFHSAGSRSLAAPNGGALLASQTSSVLVTDVQSAQSTVGFDYNVLDLEASRWINRWDPLSFRLHAGGRLAWIYQDFQVIYTEPIQGPIAVSKPTDYFGGGPRIGADAWWTIANGLGFYANASSSLLVGQFRSTLSDASSPLIYKDRFEQITPTVDLGIGLGWTSRHVRLSAGYEITHWFALASSPMLFDDTRGLYQRGASGLSLDGLTIRLVLSR